MTDEKGLLVVVSGPAGSGKGTVNQKLLEAEDFNIYNRLLAEGPEA